uniref:Small integral membrane protein 8 n=1 Tax=Molossus molossus TaxID=27622 RepID=A0A7J8GU90_MOLMO|nr:small integral membrane protein 8 [Molossus molossus]
MSSAPEEPPKEKDFRNPGLRGVRTTTLFRAVNPELFIKPTEIEEKERNIDQLFLIRAPTGD